MKIAIFSDVFNQLDGVCTHVNNIASTLTKRGHEVTVYTGSGHSDEFEIVNIPRIPFIFSPGYEVIVPRPVKIDADIVHVHTVYSVGWMGMINKKPRVVTTHTLPKHMLPDQLAFLRPFCWRYLIFFYNMADRVVCQTGRTEEGFKRRGLSKPVSIISAGVDVDFYKKGDARKFREKYKIEDDFVLHTSRLSQEKRPEFALRACRELGLRIVLSSDGPLREELRRRYPEAFFLKRMPVEDLRNAYAAARVFVLTSAPEVETEGLGPLEAMCSGVPVVCSDVPHTVRDGENGFLFETYDEFKLKLETLWHDEGLRKKFIKEGIATAKTRDIQRVVDELTEVYDKLL